MGVCFLYGNGGSGGDIKLTVFNGTTAPANPQDNYVWIKTTASLDDLLVCGKSWSPSNRAGRIWLQYEDVTHSSYQWLLKKTANVFVSIPLCGCAIANGTTWTKLEAYLYYSGEWHQFSASQYFIYHSGAATDYTGGFEALAYKASTSGSTEKAPGMELGSTLKLSLTATNAYNMGAVFSKSPIDLTNWKTLTLDVEAVQVGGEYGGFDVSLTPAKQNKFAQTAKVSVANSGTVTLDVSGLSGNYYLALSLGGVGAGFTCYASIYNIYLT